MAILLFDDISLSTNELKLQGESYPLLFICQALQYAKNGDFIRAKEKYKECDKMIMSYTELCSLTPGIGSDIRFDVWKQQIGKFIIKYEKQLELLKSFSFIQL